MYITWQVNKAVLLFPCGHLSWANCPVYWTVYWDFQQKRRFKIKVNDKTFCLGLIIPFPTWRFENTDAVKFSLSYSSPEGSKQLRLRFSEFEEDGWDGRLILLTQMESHRWSPWTSAAVPQTCPWFPGSEAQAALPRLCLSTGNAGSAQLLEVGARMSPEMALGAEEKSTDFQRWTGLSSMTNI